MDSFLFGLFSFFEKTGLALAAGIFGTAFDWIGYVPNVIQLPPTAISIAYVIAGLAGVGLAGSAVAIYGSPVWQGVHEQAVAALRSAPIRK